MEAYYYDAALQTVVSTFAGFLKPAAFQEIALGTLALAKTTGSTKILTDTRAMKVLPQENQLWLNEVWFPRATEIGIRYMAFLVPTDIFGRMSMENSNKDALQKYGIQISYFEKALEARVWLQQKQ